VLSRTILYMLNFNTGCLILYLPAYSPDLNPIEESFSTRMYLFFLYKYTLNIVLVKSYLWRHGHDLRRQADPILALLEACGCITPEMCKGWFRHAGYIL